MLELAPTPPANAFVSDPGVQQARFPLDVFICDRCAHVQLLDVVDPEALFGDYVYVSGTSPVFVKHFQDYAADIVARADLKPGDLVLDIGSNDGTLLKAFQDAGMRVLGIDPARDIAEAANRAGIETLTGFFTEQTASDILQTHGPARAITANNVYAHIDDLDSVTRGVKTLLAEDGVFSFEVSYLLDVYEKTLFDTIYHEHLDYHALAPLSGYFERHGLALTDAVRISSHGGSVRGIVHHAGAADMAAGLSEMIATEKTAGILEASGLRDYGARIDAVRDELMALLRDLKADGKSIAGFGAPAKATTLMYHFGLGPETIDFIVDDSPLKQGLYSPGLHVPVLPATAIAERQPDVLVILAWNFADPIMKNHAAFLESGGIFIVPLPNVAVYAS